MEILSRLSGIVGIIIILAICFLMSNNKSKINYKTVGVGLFLQFALAVFVLKIPLGKTIIEFLGACIRKILAFSDAGANFVFGFLSSSPDKLNELFFEGASFLFSIKLISTLIFILAIVNILYYFGIMQKIVAFFARIMYKLMDVSGAEALSNIASAFVGQVEAQIMIRPYLAGATKSELLASMTGSMACIAGGVMALYIAMGVPAEFLLAASIMAAPGALVVAKIVYPEVEQSQTKKEVKVNIERTHVNLIDSIAAAAGDGMKVSLNVIAMLIALLSLIALGDYLLAKVGLFLYNTCHIHLNFIDLSNLSIKAILGCIFSFFALIIGTPLPDVHNVGALMGEKLVLNEFIAYTDLIALKDVLSQKAMVIASFALCGFANFGSIAIQIGGIGELAPTRRKDLAKLGIRALICGTLASYISAAMAGILM